MKGDTGATGATGPAGSAGFAFSKGYLPSASDGVIYGDSQFQLLYVPSRETLAYVVAGTKFYGGAAVKLVYMHTSHVALGGVTSKAKAVLRAVRPATTENLFGGTDWETDFFEAEDAINLTITAGNSLTSPIFEFVILRSGSYVRWHLTRHDYA